MSKIKEYAVKKALLEIAEEYTEYSKTSGHIGFCKFFHQWKNQNKNLLFTFFLFEIRDIFFAYISKWRTINFEEKASDNFLYRSNAERRLRMKKLIKRIKEGTFKIYKYE
jgi:hypothetical protein